MEENNRKGPGVFYAVVGVATLVVAIIGATFAYFSAERNATLPGGTIASAGGVDLQVTKITDTSSNLIPLNLINSNGNEPGFKDQFVDALRADKGGVCKDSNGNNVCVAYRIVVTNQSTTSNIQVRGTLKLTSTAQNVHWRLINANVDGDTMTGGSKFTGAIDTNATSTGTPVSLTVGADGFTAASKTLGYTAGTNSDTYYVLVWLEETGSSQGGVDASTDQTVRGFEGEVYFSAVDAQGNYTGITASFVADSPAEGE